MKTTLSVIVFFLLQTVAFAQPITGTDVYLYEDADVKPHFEGGDTELTRFLDLLAYRMPKGCNKVSSISFGFIVEKDGSISDANAQPLTEPVCAEFIVKQVLAMHKWTPGMEDGKPIRVLCGGYVRFREDDEQAPVSVVEISDSDMLDTPPPPPPTEVYSYTDSGDTEPTTPYETTEMSEEYPDTMVFSLVERMPEFPGGDVELLNKMAKNINPAAGVDCGGTMIFSFIVEKDGSVSNIKKLRGDNNECTTQAISVLKKMPRFKPGSQNGRPVRVEFAIPIKFEPQR